jgi:Na+-translocating ferredoxin:NAD+ oxidoreductase RnfG subunit
MRTSLRILACALAAPVLALVPARSDARILLTREAAFIQVFGPQAKVDPRTVYLTPPQVEAVEQAAGAKLASARVVAYRGLLGDSLVGTAYLDTHPVRSQMETVMIVVTPEGKVGAVEVLAFNEPDDYLPPPRWLERFDGRTLSKDLKPGLAVPSLSGATLTARAVSAAVRRTLALHAALAALAPAPGAAR